MTILEISKMTFNGTLFLFSLSAIIQLIGLVYKFFGLAWC